MSFSFKSRVSKINWRLISSIDLDSIISQTKIESLQNIIDEVTFTDIDREDIQCVDNENIIKLTTLLQLLIEYLLHCQESQFKIVQTLSQKNKMLRSKEQESRQLYLQTKEISDSYRKQVEFMKSTLVAPDREAIWDRQYSQTNNANDSIQLINSILSSEKETRQAMISSVESQKAAFLQEMGRIMTTSMERDARDNSATQNQIADSMNQFMRKFECFVEETVPQRAAQQQQQQQLQRELDEAKQANANAMATIALLRSQAEAQKAETDRLSAVIENMRAEHEQQRAELQESQAKLEAEVQKEREFAAHAKSTALKLITTNVAQEEQRAAATAFLRWKGLVITNRERAAEEEYSRRLRLATVMHARRVDELHAQLESAHARAEAEATRSSALQNQCQELSEKLAEQLTQPDHHGYGEGPFDRVEKNRSENRDAVSATQDDLESISTSRDDTDPSLHFSLSEVTPHSPTHPSSYAVDRDLTYDSLQQCDDTGIPVVEEKRLRFADKGDDSSREPFALSDDERTERSVGDNSSFEQSGYMDRSRDQSRIDLKAASLLADARARIESSFQLKVKTFNYYSS